jgi:hypothetical protein
MYRLATRAGVGLCGLAVVVCLTLLALPQAAHAAIGLNPSKIELFMEAGETEEFVVTVSSDSPSAYITDVHIWDFARDESGQPVPIDPEDAEEFHGGSAWVQPVTEAPQGLPPEGSSRFEFAVTVPEDAEDGTRFCYVTFTSVPVQESEESDEPAVEITAPLSYALSALLLVTVGEPAATVSAPTLARAVTVEDLGIETFNLDSEVPIRAAIRNDGNVHMNLSQGSGVQIWRGDMLVDQIAFSEFTLLPEDTLAIPAAWEADSSFGRYTARFVGDVGLEEPVVAEQTFYVISWPWLVALGAAAILVPLLLILFFRRFKIQFAPRAEAQSGT